jgi:hypothetical protein
LPAAIGGALGYSLSSVPYKFVDSVSEICSAREVIGRRLPSIAAGAFWKLLRSKRIVNNEPVISSRTILRTCDLSEHLDKA